MLKFKEVQELIRHTTIAAKNRDKIVTSTLSDFQHVFARRAGNTTRQIDLAIQSLFSGHIVICLDHYEHGLDRESNERLMGLIQRRLMTEHDMMLNKSILVNPKRFTLELIPYERN